MAESAAEVRRGRAKHKTGIVKGKMRSSLSDEPAIQIRNWLSHFARAFKLPKSPRLRKFFGEIMHEIKAEFPLTI
jgi:hypothetical protein